MRALVLSVVLLACKRDAAPSASGPDAAPITVEPMTSSAPVASASPSSSVVSVGEPVARRSDTNPVEADVPPEGSDLENAVAKVGKTTIWGIEDGDGTRIVAKAGEGKPRLLRRTSGKVKAFDAITLGSDIVVAWASELAAGGTQVVALVTASSDLSKVTPPTTIAMVAAPIQLAAHVAIAKNPKGGVIVVHQGPMTSCMFLDHPSECLTFEVKSVTSAGVVTKLAREKLDGGPSPEFRLLDVDGRWLAVLASSMRGGRSLAGVVVPYDASDPKPAFGVPICGGVASHFPELLRGASGEIVSVCLDTRIDNPKCGRPLRGDGDRCLRVAAFALDGKDLAPGVKRRTAAVQKVECGDGGGASLVLEGGSAIGLPRGTDLEVMRDFLPKCGP